MTTETHSSTEHGMSNAGYVRIAAILAAITALEVATYYVDFGALFLPSLRLRESCLQLRVLTLNMVRGP
jgi:hypothetical protein